MDMTDGAQLIPPYGGALVDLLAGAEERQELRNRAERLPSVQLSPRSVCDLEMLAVGAFSPLDRFMGSADYRSVLGTMRLANGTLFPVPVTLPVESADGLAIGGEVVLRGPTFEILAIMRLEEVYAWDLREEALAVLGTDESRHPLVAEMHSWGRLYLSGQLRVLAPPRRVDFPDLRKTPAETRATLARMGRDFVIGYQPRHPMHRAHEALTKAASSEVDGSLLINPVAGLDEAGETDGYTRVRCYQALIRNRYDAGSTLLNLMPLAARMAGPRAGLWHGIINRNYGVSHFIIGRDPHGPGKDSCGKDFYDTYDVQRLFRDHERELGVRMIPLREMVYMPTRNKYEESRKAESGDERFIRVSATEVIAQSRFQGKALPEWFTYPEVARIIQEANPPRTRQGFCIWLTGLPSSGKSTIASALAPMLLARGRKITLLDGDVVRTHLGKGLGFGKEDRVTNILRVGFVASEIVRHEGTVICALISPYRAARDQVRSMMGEGRFIEVFVDTPVTECERRDVKGLYAQARQGRIKGFTGVDDCYEAPQAPECGVNTVDMTPQESAQVIVDELIRNGFLPAEAAAPFVLAAAAAQVETND